MKHLLIEMIKRVYRIMDTIIVGTLVRLLYSSHPEGANNLTFLRYSFFQKILGFNRSVPWPVHFTSQVTSWENIRKGRRVNPGYSTGNYIQAVNGILFGSNIRIGPNVCIISANHDIDDYDFHVKTKPIEIGNNVWIGANCVVLPAVRIGNNVVIGAGSIVGHDIPDNSIAAGNPCRVIREKPPYKGRPYS
jgi:acetyltransferase-like isoleucine patch superfamily enzyme